MDPRNNVNNFYHEDDKDDEDIEININGIDGFIDGLVDVEVRTKEEKGADEDADELISQLLSDHPNLKNTYDAFKETYGNTHPIELLAKAINNKQLNLEKYECVFKNISNRLLKPSETSTPTPTDETNSIAAELRKLVDKSLKQARDKLSLNIDKITREITESKELPEIKVLMEELQNLKNHFKAQSNSSGLAQLNNICLGTKNLLENKDSLDKKGLTLRTKDLENLIDDLPIKKTFRDHVVDCFQKLMLWMTGEKDLAQRAARRFQEKGTSATSQKNLLFLFSTFKKRSNLVTNVTPTNKSEDSLTAPSSSKGKK